MAFSPKSLRYTFKLATGTFAGSGGANIATFSDLRSTVELTFSAGSYSATGSVVAVAVIFGLGLNNINSLARAGFVYQVKQPNQILIEANDGVTGWTTAFVGEILEASPQFRQQPEVALVVSANAVQGLSLKAATPNSFRGSTDVKDVFKVLAQTAGLTLEANNINVKLASPYLHGSIIDQIVRCAAAANVNHHIDPIAGVLAIWPKDSTREGDPIVISPSNESINYPEFQANLVRVRTLFNPNLKVGKKIMVKSQLTAANGLVSLTEVSHFLSAQLPDGSWHTECTGTPVPALQSGSGVPVSSP